MIRPTHSLAVLAILFGAAPAFADQILPPGRIVGNTGDGDILFGSIKFGRRQGGKTILQPDSLRATLGAILPGQFWAKAYSDPATGLPCVWSEAGDAGPCIQAALDAAGAAKGGRVILDGGAYAIRTELRNYVSGVNLIGLGTGEPRSNGNGGAFFAAQTRLVWLGAAGATMYYSGPQPGADQSLRSAGVDGVVFDGRDRADVCAKFVSVNYSTLRLGGAECRSVNIWTTTANIPDNPGTQNNDMWLYSRSTTPTSTATGIFLDGNLSSHLAGYPFAWNTSYNRMHVLYTWHSGGDGIVFGDSDNNVVHDINQYTQSDAPKKGTPIVFASTGYTMPNGMKTSGAAYANLILHTGGTARLGGFTMGSTVTPKAGGNTGSANPAAVTKSTSAIATITGTTIPFASTADVAPGLTMSCGGTENGVIPGNAVTAVSPTIVTIQTGVLRDVPAGTTCTFTYGFTAKARMGTYTLTATSPKTFSLTAPAGGNSQTGVTLANGILSFTDLVIPMSGTAAAGDDWTITAQQASFQNVFKFIDKANSGSTPMYNPGAVGTVQTSLNPFPLPPMWSGSYVPLGRAVGSATGERSFAIGEGPNASGVESMAMGSCAATAPLSICLGGGSTGGGFGGIAIGHNVTSIGVYSLGAGEGTSVSGSYSAGFGAFGTDRGDSALMFSNGRFSTGGDAQIRTQVARASLSSTAPARLTADGAAANPGNGLRIPPNALFGTIVEQVVCRETATPANWAKWKRKDGVLTRDTGSPSYAGDASAPTAPDQSGGTGTSGASLVIFADTGNNVLAANVTWPNAKATRCVADIRTVEMQ